MNEDRIETNQESLTAEELLGLAEFRSTIYGFLSSVYLNIPDRDFVNRLFSEEVISFLSTLPLDMSLPEDMVDGLEDMKSFIKTLKDQAVEDVLESLSIERTRLLRGLKPGYGPPPPYESVYREEGEDLMGKSAIDVGKEYARAGVSVPSDHKEPPDYIGLELAFMRFLALEEAESWKNNQSDEAVSCLNRQCNFLKAHINKWIPKFCDNVLAESEPGFYRGIARMTKGFVTDDQVRIEDFISIMSQ